MMLDFELLTEFGDHSIVEIDTIIRNDSLWDTVPTDGILFDEPGHNILGNESERSCLKPLREVVNGDENETVSIRCSRLDLPNHSNAPHCKWPRSSHDI